jgi:membrane-bound serine protease (ClpP class)
MMVIPPAIGVILILIGIVLFIVDLHVISHGLLTAGGIFTLLAGGLALLGAGVPYSGVLLGVLVVVAMLMGRALRGLGFFALSKRQAGSYRQGGDDR